MSEAPSVDRAAGMSSAGDALPASDAQVPAVRQQRWAQAWHDGARCAWGEPIDAASAWQGEPTKLPGLAERNGEEPGSASAALEPGVNRQTVDGAATPRTLADWRSRHARHEALQAREGAGPSPRSGSDDHLHDDSLAAAQSAVLTATAAPSSAMAAPENHGAVNAPRNTDDLHSLVESCCTRLLVAPGGAGAAPAVLMDLGRVLPGCSIEIARSAGVLRLTLRGASGDRRDALGDGLEALRESLQQRLGCPVLLAIEDQPGGGLR